VVADYNQKVDGRIDDIGFIERPYYTTCLYKILNIYSYAQIFFLIFEPGNLLHRIMYKIWNYFTNYLFYFQQPAQTTPIQPEGQGTPSLSPTPSPAGSVGSVGSQSSGYSSGELANRGVPSGQAPGVSSGQCVNMPLHVHNATMKQSQHLGLLMNSLELWDQAISRAREEEHRGIYGKYKKILDVSY